MSRMRLIGIVLCCLLMLPSFAAKDKKTRKEPLFGKAQASYQITSDALKGAERRFIWLAAMEVLILDVSGSIKEKNCMKMNMRMILFCAWEGNC